MLEIREVVEGQAGSSSVAAENPGSEPRVRHKEGADAATEWEPVEDSVQFLRGRDALGREAHALDRGETGEVIELDPAEPEVRLQIIMGLATSRSRRPAFLRRAASWMS